MTFCHILFYWDTEKDLRVESSQDSAEYYNSLEIRTGSIQIADLITIIHKLEDDEEETFEKEFNVRHSYSYIICKMMMEIDLTSLMQSIWFA